MLIGEEDAMPSAIATCDQALHRQRWQCRHLPCDTNELDGGVLLRGRFQPILQSVADARLGHEKSWPIRVRLDLLPKLTDENTQILDVVTLVAVPYVFQQLFV